MMKHKRNLAVKHLKKISTHQATNKTLILRTDSKFLIKAKIKIKNQMGKPYLKNKNVRLKNKNRSKSHKRY